MKKSIKKLQKHKDKKYSKKHKKTIKRKHPHHKTRKYSKKYKGGNGDDNESPTKKARHNPPNEEEENTAIQKEQNKRMITFMLKAKKIEDKGPIIVPLSAPETVYALMVKILNLWNYVIQNIRIPHNIDTARKIIDTLYNDVVNAVPQDLEWDDDEPQSEILNYKSSEILGELFHNVSNITDKTINQVIEIPSIYIFTAPDIDNPDIVQLIQENNHAEEE